MRLAQSPWALRVLLGVTISVLLLCVVSSAAFKFNPRAGKSSASLAVEVADSDSGEVTDESVGGGGLKANSIASGLERKKGNSRDYVFAKVNNPKLVRPKGKNSRTEEDDDDQEVASSEDRRDRSDDDDDNLNDNDDDNDDTEDDEKSDDVDDDESRDESKEDDDDSEDGALKRRNKQKKTTTTARPEKLKIKRGAVHDDRENAGDENRSRKGGESADKNKKAKKVKPPASDRDDDDDDDSDVNESRDDDTDDQVVVEKQKKKAKKVKQSVDDEDEEEEIVPKKKSKKKSKADDDDKNEKPKSKKKKSGKGVDKKDSDSDDDNSPWWNFFGFFDVNKDEESFLKVIQKKREEENAQIKMDNEKSKKKRKSDEKEPGKSWLSFLNRKPFTFLFDFDFDDYEEQSEDEKRDTEPEKGEMEMKKGKKKSGPLSTDDFEEILAYIPSFVPNYTSIENIDCRRQGQIFHRQLRGQKLWAFQMIDAGGKIGSGILHGNINQLGNFDLCTEIATRVKITEDTIVRVKGKYCLAHLDIQATDENLKYLMHLINGKSLLRSTINDPSHFVPRFTTFNWGVCVPAACTVEDVQEFLEASLEDYNSTGIKLNIEIDEENCHVAEKFHWDKLLKENYEIVVILACVSSVLVLVVLATLNQCWLHWRSANIVIQILDGTNGGDVGQKDGEDEFMISLNGAGGEPEPPGLLNSLILQFSLKDTWSQLTAVKEGEIECIHGIKAIAAIGLFFILKVMQLIRAPYANRVDLTEILNSPWTLILRSPLLFMDVFLLLTGFLTSYSLLKKYEETGKFPVASSVFGKLVRMLPLLALATLFHAHIWPHLGSGPQWNEIVGTHSKLCVEKWWKNLLFIQTGDKIEDACDPISYQFAVQMGLFLISPVIVWTMAKKPDIGLGLFGAISALSVAMRYSQTQSNRLAPVFYHGIKMTQIYRTMDADHGSIIHRATPFVNGLGLGIVLLQFGKKVKIPRASNIALWTLSIIGLVWCLFSQTHVTQRTYVYDAAEMAQVAAWVPLIWSYSIMWIIFACYSGNGVYVNKFLSAKPLIFISRIAFALHFVQYVVLSSNSAKTRAVGHFEVSQFINTFELCVILLVSVFLTLTFDLPMQNVRDLLKNWQWNWTAKESEASERKESTSGNGTESAPAKKSTEALFKSNGNLDSSRFDWNKKSEEKEVVEEIRENNSPPRGQLGNFNNHRNVGDEHLDTYGNGDEEYEEEEEVEEEELSSGGNEGGNSAPIHEEVDDIWGSDNE